jgi:hypothetical protein
MILGLQNLDGALEEDSQKIKNMFSSHFQISLPPTPLKSST